MEVYFIMENINYNGVDGVFIPNKEFEYIKQAIKNNRVLLESLIKDLAKTNPNLYDYLLSL